MSPAVQILYAYTLTPLDFRTLTTPFRHRRPETSQTRHARSRSQPMKTQISAIFRISFPPALLLALCAAASPAEKETVLSWRDCVRLAAENNPVILGSARTLDSARAKYLAGWNAFFPQISLTHDYSRSNSLSAGYQPYSWAAGVGASETLFSMKSSADIKIRSAVVEQARYAYLQDSASVRYGLLSAFLSLLHAQENVKVAENILTLRERNARMISLQYAGGRESKGNNMKAGAQAFQARADLSQAKRQALSAGMELAHRLGVQSFENLIVTGTFSASALDENTDTAAIAENAPPVLLAKAALRLAEEQFFSAKSDRFPVLSASQSLNWRDRTEPPSPRYWSMGFTLSLPFLSGGPTFSHYNTQSASKLLEKARLDLDEARLAAKTELRSLLFRVSQAVDNVQVNKQLLEAAIQRHLEAEIQYVSGRMIFQNWEIVEQELVTLESNYLNSLRDASIAIAAWDKSRGVPLGE